MMPITQYDAYSPFEASLVEKTPAEKQELFRKFSSLPDGLREALVSPDTAQYIADWERAGLFPANYRTAVAKTMMLAGLGEVALPSLPALFTRIGLPQQQANSVAEAIRAVVEPYQTTPDEEVPEVTLDPELGPVTEMREIPPLSSTEESQKAPIDVPQTPPRTTVEQVRVPNPASHNIIDLRKESADKSSQ